MKHIYTMFLINSHVKHHIIYNYDYIIYNIYVMMIYIILYNYITIFNYIYIHINHIIMISILHVVFYRSSPSQWPCP